MTETKVSSFRRSKWEIQKSKLKIQFSKLTDTDLNFDETRKNEMLSSLEFKLGMTKEELQVIIETL